MSKSEVKKDFEQVLRSVRLEKVEVSLDFICSEVDFKGNQTFELIDWIGSIYFFMRRSWVRK